jgi:hypothetical protein
LQGRKIGEEITIVADAKQQDKKVVLPRKRKTLQL